MRLHPHAQEEIRICAQAVLKLIEELDQIKWSVEIFKEMVRVKYAFQEALGKCKGNFESLKDHIKSYQ